MNVKFVIIFKKLRCCHIQNITVRRIYSTERHNATMLQLAICDDEKVYRNDLHKIIRTELELSGMEFHISEFASGEELLRELKNTDCQIIFLDIELKELDGVNTARKLREQKNPAVIIFVTSYPDFVFQGYEVRALNYIMKPYEPEKIKAVLRTALEELDLTSEKYYVIEQRSGIIRIPLNSIKYFASDRRVIHLVTDNASYDFYDKLNDLESGLPDAFVRIHNRYLIHLKYLDQIDGNFAIVDGESLPISRSCKSDLTIAFAKYMLH